MVSLTSQRWCVLCSKLSRFAEQIGANRTLVCAKFQEAMNDLLNDIEDAYFLDAKPQSK